RGRPCGPKRERQQAHALVGAAVGGSAGGAPQWTPTGQPAWSAPTTPTQAPKPLGHPIRLVIAVALVAFIGVFAVLALRPGADQGTGWTTFVASDGAF